MEIVGWVLVGLIAVLVVLVGAILWSMGVR